MAEVNLSPYTAEYEAIQRRRKLADTLMQQGLKEEPINQMAGGYVLRNPKGASLVKALMPALSMVVEQYTNNEASNLAQKERADRARDFSDLVSALQPRPAIEAPSEELGGGPGRPAMPAAGITPELMGRLNTPDAQKMAFQMMAETLKPKSPITLAQGATLIDPTTGKTIAQGAPKYHSVGGSLVPEPTQPGTTVTPAFTAPEKLPDAVRTANEVMRLTGINPTSAEGQQILKGLVDKTPESVRAFTANLQMAGIDPQSPQGKQLFQAYAVKAATHPPAQNVNVAVSTEKKYGEQFAGQIAKADSDMRDSAIKAPQLAERANTVLKLLSDGRAITGTAADFRLQFAKAAQLAGFGNGTAADTETVATSLAQNTLDAIKASGLGAGSGFSNADRDFLEKAVGGKINLEKETLQRLASLSYRASVESAKRWNQRVTEIPRSALEGTGIKQDPISVPDMFTPQRRSTDRPASQVRPGDADLINKYLKK